MFKIGDKVVVITKEYGMNQYLLQGKICRVDENDKNFPLWCGVEFFPECLEKAGRTGNSYDTSKDLISIEVYNSPLYSAMKEE